MRKLIRTPRLILSPSNKPKLFLKGGAAARNAAPGKLGGFRLRLPKYL